MPTIISHPAAAVALAPVFRRLRVPVRVLAAGAACTIVPDFDVVGFAFGVGYGDLLGHRGLSHSLLFAAALAGLIVAVIGQDARVSRPWCFVYLFLCTASHGLLDALTSGGLGVAFFAPFDGGRYFFPWQPIRVSPIGVRRFFTDRGLAVMASEILWVWFPALLLAVAGVVWSKLAAQRDARN
jgi:inner membrane protein